LGRGTGSAKGAPPFKLEVGQAKLQGELKAVKAEGQSALQAGLAELKVGQALLQGELRTVKAELQGEMRTGQAEVKGGMVALALLIVALTFLKPKSGPAQ
jgi:hypothetical protein